MTVSRAKQFENKFKEDWLKLPNAFVLRLPDQQSGYRGSSTNPCDFICYSYPNLFLLELKSHEGNVFPFSAFRQYDKLKDIESLKIDGVKVGVILWMIDHDKLLYIPIDTFIKLKNDDKKSFNIKYLESKEYFSVEIPSNKPRN